MDPANRTNVITKHLRVYTNCTGAIGETEDSATTATAIGGSDSNDPYAIELEFVDLDGIPEVPLVGSDSDLSEDYLAGLNLMSQRVHPKTKLGYIDTAESGHVLLCVKPSSVRKVLTTSVQHFLGGLRPPSAAFFGRKVLFILEGKEWLHLRNVMKKSFQKHNVKMMTESIHVATNGLRGLLDRYAKSGKDVDFMRALSLFHLSAIGRASFDCDLGSFDSFEDGLNEMEQSFEFLLEELPRRAYSPDWETQNNFTNDTVDNREMKRYSTQARNVIRKLIEDRLAYLKTGAEKRQDFLQSMIDVYTEDCLEASGDASLLTTELGDNLVEIAFAGYNTTVPTVSHSLFFLASNPEIFNRVRAEVDQVCGKRLPTDSDIKKLDLTQRVFQETLRLCPPASLIARQMTKDVELDGVVVRAASRVWLPACYIHRDPDSWENPNAFNPDRFLKKIIRGSFIPFSDGARSCIGRNFAIAEAITALAMVVQNFDVAVCKDFDWTTVFTGFGLRPFDFSTARVSMRLNVFKREH